MKKIIFSIMLMMMPIAAAFAQDVIGKWKLEDGTAIVEVYKSGDSFNGKIVWLKNPTEADGTPAKDDNNPNGSEYTGGKIYDPGNGKTYNCSMKVEGDVLKVRGSLDKKGLIGRTMDWFRVK